MADAPVRLIWSLALSGPPAGLPTTLTVTGNSGTFNAATPNAKTALDLRWADDIWFSVNVANVVGTTPSLTVSLDGFDDQGNLFPGLFSLPALTAAGQKVGFAGRHGGSGANTYLVLPEWGRISWVISGAGATFTGTEIALYTRG